MELQCEDVQTVERKLQEMNTKYVKRIVEEGGIYVDQLFIHDPDCYMVEICNCENLPVEPIVQGSESPCSVRSPSNRQAPLKGFENIEACTHEIQSTVMEQIIILNATPRPNEFAV